MSAPALSDLPLIASGKVREMYDLSGVPGRGDAAPRVSGDAGEHGDVASRVSGGVAGEHGDVANGASGDAAPGVSGGAGEPRLLMVASDRISTYDAVHPTPIPDKGKVLTGLSVFWFDRTKHIVANHLISATEGLPQEAKGRGMIVRRLHMLPVECVVRGYITGSGWKDYQATGSVSGIALPAGLQESEQLPQPIFTPSTKATDGHDEAIDFERACELVEEFVSGGIGADGGVGGRGGGPGGGIDGRALMARVKDVSIELYSFAAEHARQRGVILADTKFEFGLDAEGNLTIGDEVLTPDSSRYWPADGYEAGRGQPSFDKQYVRDWASGSGWDKLPPAPAIPDEVVEGTRERYVEAYERIVGEPFADWLRRAGCA